MSDPHKNKFQELLDKLNDGELNQSDLEAFKSELEDQKTRKQFYKESIFNSALQEILNEDQKSSDVIRKNHQSSRILQTPTKSIYSSKKGTYTALSGIAALFLIGLFFIIQFKVDENVKSIANIDLSHGDIDIIRGDIIIKAKSNYIIKGNDQLVLRKNSMLKLTYKDGSNIQLGPGTTVKFNKHKSQKHIELIKGSLFANINKQKEHMTLKSIDSLTTVLGTQFHLHNNTKQTTLRLKKGKLLFSNTHTQKSLQSNQKINSNNMEVENYTSTLKSIDLKFQLYNDETGVLIAQNKENQRFEFHTNLNNKYIEYQNEAFLRLQLKRLNENTLLHIQYYERGYRELVNLKEHKKYLID
jgi:hypothetical protein